MLYFFSLFPPPVVSMEGQKTIDPCKFNILFTKSVPHILETIFFSLDYDSFKACLQVNSTWRELLASESYIKEAKSLFHVEITHDEKKLLKAAKEGNVEVVRTLSLFVNVNCQKGGTQSTPLHEAAMNVPGKYLGRLQNFLAFNRRPSNHKYVDKESIFG